MKNKILLTCQIRGSRLERQIKWVEEANEYQRTRDSGREPDFISAGVARMIFLRLPSSVRLRFYFSFVDLYPLYSALDRSFRLFRRWPHKRIYKL